MEQSLAMLLRELYPVMHHIEVALRNFTQHNRVLHNTVQRRENMSCGNLGLFGRVPFEHIGVNCGGAACKAKACDAGAVGDHITRTVGGTEHISVLADCGSDITLTELDKDIGLNGLQTLHHALHQYIYSLRNTLYITTCVVLLNGRICAVDAKRVDKIQLEAVQIPIAQSLLVGRADKLSHLGKSRIEYARHSVGSVIEGEVFTLEAFVVLAVNTYKRHRVPQHIFHTHSLHPLDMGCHILDAHICHLPIAAIGVASIVVGGLPTVIHNDSLHAELRGFTALGLDLLVGNLLVELIPRRVERVECGIGNTTNLKVVLRLDPLHTFTHGICPEDISIIEHDGNFVVRKRSVRLDKKSQNPVE